MKKLLGILVLGLLFCSNSFAEKIAVKKAIKLPKDIVQGYNEKMKGRTVISVIVVII